MPTKNSPPPVKPTPSHQPVDLATESVAGEEDPGAALEDLVDTPVPPSHDPARPDPKSR